MKKRIISSLQALAADRYLLSILALFVLSCLVLVVFLGFAIHPSERQVATRYTSFGTTNFYRDKWYYMLSFIGFTVLMAIVHLLLIFKILREKGRDFAIAFAWLGVIIVGIAAALFFQILKIASII